MTARLVVRRTTHPAPAPTRRACQAAAHFAVSLECAAPPRANPARITLDTKPGQITLITGASGSGKSTLLRDIARAAHNPIQPPNLNNLPNKPCVDLIDQPVIQALQTLAIVGLADITAFIHRPAELSEGQRARLRLAIAISQLDQTATNTPIIIADEFASNLDPLTARALACSVARFARHSGAHLFLASPREDLAEHLHPTTTITTHRHAPLQIRRAAPRPTKPFPINIEPASIDDYAALAHFHYRAAKPATIVKLLRATDPATNQLAAVLTISMPTLNAAWRANAWPAQFDMRKDKPRDTARLNAQLRSISRVIVDPRYRSLSIASRLVRAYLRNPITPCTESIAAMGIACPFLKAAGMTEYRLTPSRRDARLLDALHHARIEHWRLATPSAALRRARSAKQFIESEVAKWVSASKATHRFASAPFDECFSRACASLIAAPIAYAHTAQTPSPTGDQS